MSDPESEQKALLDVLLSRPGAEAKEVSFSLLQDITKNFSKELKLGSGKFGEVYKGQLQNGMEIAVKKLNPLGQTLDDEGFHAEVHSLKKLKHKNIVRILGYCVHSETEETVHNGRKILAEANRERLLCFELLPNGTIPNKAAHQGLGWTERYEIIKGICHGLECIHNAGYIHLDLKPDNILLDSNMVPKITDFGTAQFFGNQSTRNTMNRPGTFGYYAPEFLEQGTVSKKADIYSLGVVILEVVTGNKGPAFFEIRGKEKEEEEMYLVKELTHWKRQLVAYNGFEQACQQVETCIKIALNCKGPREYRRQIKEIAQIIDMSLDPNITEALFVKNFDSLHDMDVHPDKPWVLLSLESGCIGILDYDRKELCGSFKLCDKPVHSAKFNNKEGDRWNIVAGDDRGLIHVMHSGGHTPNSFIKVKSTLAASDGKGIRSLAVHPSKPHVLVSTGNNVMIWNTEDWTCIRMHHGPGYFKTVTHASFNTNDARVFGTGCCSGKVKLWCYHTDNKSAWGTERRPYLQLRANNKSEPICSICYFTCNNARFIVTGTTDKTAKVWKYNKELPTTSTYSLESIIGPEATFKHSHGVTAICYNPKLNTIITGTDGGVVSIWCSIAYRCKRILCFGLGRICALASCLTTGRRIFISHENGFVMVDIAPKQEL